MKIKDMMTLLVILLVDQVSKYVFFLGDKNSIEIIEDFFYITKVKNRGAAWGAFANKMWLFYIVSVIAIYFLFKLYKRSENKASYLKWASLLMLAGTIGNFIDRLYFQYVRDFLNFFIFKYDYPVFNVADISLVIGVGLLILFIIKHPDEEII